MLVQAGPNGCTRTLEAAAAGIEWIRGAVPMVVDGRADYCRSETLALQRTAANARSPLSGVGPCLQHLSGESLGCQIHPEDGMGQLMVERTEPWFTYPPATRI